jgi:hypothetical protein
MTAPPPVQVLEREGATGRGWLPREAAMAAATVARREWVAAVFGGSAVFATVTTLTSFNAPERLWGGCAAVTYAVAAVIAAAVRRRGVSLAVLISLAGALAVPLAWMAAAGMAQPEVDVVIRSAAMLVHHGTPYPSPAALAAAHTWRAYDPYLPALIVFGVPRVFGGGLLTDPRLWFGLAFVAGFGAAVRVAGVPRPVWWTMLVTASPVVALPLDRGQQSAGRGRQPGGAARQRRLPGVSGDQLRLRVQPVRRAGGLRRSGRRQRPGGGGA